MLSWLAWSLLPPFPPEEWSTDSPMVLSWVIGRKTLRWQDSFANNVSEDSVEAAQDANNRQASGQVLHSAQGMDSPA